MSDGPVRTDQAFVESHESEYITPKDAVATKAQADVYNVETVLHSAGIPLEQIHAAAELNAKNARLEFEANENADPLRRIIGVLETSAVSGRDKEVIAERVKILETQRAGWTALIDKERTRARMQGKDFSFEDTVKNAIGYNQAPTFSTYDDNRRPVVFFEVLNRTRLKSAEGTDQEVVMPSDECLDKVLKGLGVLQGNDKSNDLRMLPSSSKTPEGKPRYSHDFGGKAEDLPTNIPESKAMLFFSENRLMVNVGAKALEKIVAFPASV